MRKLRSLLLAGVGCAVYLLTGPSIASAATVSGNVSFYEFRVDCSNNTGSRLPCGGTNKPLPGGKISLWDVDGCIDWLPTCNDSGGSLDDFLAETSVDANGNYSVSGIGTLEDVYLVYEGKSDAGVVLPPSGGIYLVAGLPVTDIGGNVDIDINLSCPWDNDAICTQQQAINNFAGSALANLAASMSQVLDFANIDSNITDQGINLYYPNASECTGLAGFAWEQTEICIATGFETSNHVVGHEMGHLYHARSFDDPAGSLTAGDLVNGTTSCGSGGFWAGNESQEKCTTVEGWASFFSAASWWAQTSTAPRYRTFQLEGWTTLFNGGSAQPCISAASNPHWQIGNVTRFFWDCYDTNNSDTTNMTGNDNDSVSLHLLNDIWEAFPFGTQNRQSAESGQHGRNVRDYQFWDDAIGEVFQGERDLNCVGGMTNN